MAIKLYSGLKIGKLTILRKDENKDGWNRTKYLCLCECGEEKSISANYLNGEKKKILSCGCLKRNKDPKQISFVNRYNQDKKNALNRGLDFLLTKEQHKNLILLDCFYCGRKPDSSFTPYLNKDGSLKKQTIKQNINLNHIKQTIIQVNGIDRFDNNIGYLSENCVTSCWLCNKAKNEMHGNDFIKLIHTISAYLTLKDR